MRYPRDRKTERQVQIFQLHKTRETKPKVPPAHFQDSYDPIYEAFLQKHLHLERIK